ncbi:MAG: SUMF1/EgtB/PvdO family nonheme iron enzyme, partial [Planctomycetaceae bacterium]
YTDFLNAVDPNGTNPYGIYIDSMATNNTMKGILFSAGAASGQKYSPIGSAARPITLVSWFSAARFANWMQNGQGSGSTETGAYTLGGATSGNAVARNPGATFSIPTENEWYKAAYYSPVKGGVGSPGYYAYATQSDSAPGNVVGPAANQANSYTGVFSVTQSASYDTSQTYLTDVGAFTNSASYYGTFDQSGNVYQWNDLDGTAGPSRGTRGGSWDYSPSAMSSSSSDLQSPSAYGRDLGFRLASPAAVPEPSTWFMALAGLACGGWWVSRRRRGPV